MAQKTGSETIGAAGEKSKMTLFKDDRAEDIGAIIIAALVIAYIMVATAGKSAPPPPAPAAPATATAPAPAPAAPAPATPATK
jgi:hypothetical protein